MSTSITAPATGYTGDTWLGPTLLQFEDGTATFDGDLSDGQRQYLESNGYGIDGPASEPQAAPEVPDPRDLDVVQVGTELRDAAVDPSEEDFLPPTNAGDANPHGPEVVSPGIHAAETKAVVPGDVGKPLRQNKRETELAQRTLSADELVPDVTADLAADAEDTSAADAAAPEAGDAGDAAATAETPAPATVPEPDAGATTDSTPPPAAEPDSNMPAKNASADEWRAYAVSKGMSSEDADNASRDQLVAQYTA